MVSRSFRLALFAAIVFPALQARAEAAPADHGRELFVSKCAVCHGTAGDGKGPAAYLLNPKPRDFTQAVYRFKSTPIGSLPTDADLMRTLTNGIPGTSMPKWDGLSETERKDLVEYIKTFSTRFQEEQPHDVITINAEPIPDQASIDRGKNLFKANKCDTCHGSTGHGDGPNSVNLKDDAGMPIRPRNFTYGDRFRGGKNPQDIYRAIMVGMEGTPMAGYGLAERDTWDLVHFVQSLAVQRPNRVRPGDNTIPVGIVSGELPIDPSDQAWYLAAGVPVPVRPLWTRDDAPDYVIIKGLTNGTDIGFAVEWPDSIANKTVLRSQDFRDAVAIQFPVKPVSADSAAPFYGMGEKGGLVDIWHWKADWQEDLVRFNDVTNQYASNAIDQYPREAAERKTYTTGWEAGNPMSVRDRKTAVEDLNATGLGTLTSQPAGDQNVDGWGTWADGVWRVVFKRSLKSAGPNDVQFSKETAAGTRIAVSVWNGAEGDRNGQKLVSEWHPLRLDLSEIQNTAAAPAKGADKGGSCSMGSVTGSAAPVLFATVLVSFVVTRKRWRSL